MKILRKRTRDVPKSFVCVCEKGGNHPDFNRGCGALLEVFYKDCFKTEVGKSEVAFFCESCGIVLCPIHDWLDYSYHNYPMTREYRDKFTPLTKENTPPWSPFNMPTMSEYCKANNINWSLR